MNFPPHVLAPYFHIQRRQLVITDSMQTLVKASPDRVLFAAGFSSGGGNVLIYPGPITALGEGWLLPANTVQRFNYFDWGQLVCEQWFTIDPTAVITQPTLWIVEQLWRPEVRRADRERINEQGQLWSSIDIAPAVQS